MATNIVIPEVGESVRTGVITSWLKKSGEIVKRDEPVLELETDKVTLEVVAPAAGKVEQSARAGDTVAVGSVVGRVMEASPAEFAAASSTMPAEMKTAAVPEARAPIGHDDVRATPLARKVAAERGVDLKGIAGTGAGGRIREHDVISATTAGQSSEDGVGASTAAVVVAKSGASSGRGVRRQRMSPLRQRLASRLVEAQHAAAMLTTFNECDMTSVIHLRKKYKDEFEKKQGVGLGFMSFFVKAAAGALRAFPAVNAYLVAGPDGPEVESHDYIDIAVAVSTPKGLTVPVLRDCQSLSMAGVEGRIKDLAARARDGKLTLDEMQGGTFTITNGGVFGSLMSTPILNPPQTAILGMHTIKNRAVEDPDRPGQVAIRPMMYLALSYDHRVIDGSEAVQFLVFVKNAVENPERLLLDI
ncbi:MAG: 2-oxoglutarate dehydrogenase complex dihydrolipoyllysine-residue succinyltransferase [Phycisphaerae bacterium]|nr:2-oxoglutarate dehydrogenase complex dihydrolipoyllysine-residue succinyltransferase [Phycisphaerae bacterium]